MIVKTSGRLKSGKGSKAIVDSASPLLVIGGCSKSALGLQPQADLER
jgi:hypothetical protein